MKTAFKVVIPARFASTRLPGKPLLDIAGKPMIAHVCQRALEAEAEQVVVATDDPLIPPAYINAVAAVLAGQTQAGIATLAAQIHNIDEIFNPNAVKVVLDKEGYALYFSRAPIPWVRRTFPEKHSIADAELPHLRHIGIYAYTVGFLRRYCQWPTSTLEGVEALEQLRILWLGEKIRVQIVEQTPEAGVDTEEDLQRVTQRLLGDSINAESC